MLHPADAYRTTYLRSATPAELLVLLYDRAILCLKGAADHLTAGRLAAKGQALGAAMDVLVALDAALDRVQGGVVADALAQLYRYALRRLTTANARNDRQPIDEVIQLLETVRDGWRHVAAPAGRAAGGPVTPVDPTDSRAPRSRLA